MDCSSSYKWQPPSFNSFSFNNNPLSLSNLSSNIESDYKTITETFCRHYYDYYDNNFDKIKNLCADNTYFTYLDDEILGFDNLVNIIKNKGINKFRHDASSMNISSQPTGTRSLIINVTGVVHVNDNPTKYKFSETIILKRSGTRYYIQNIIFKVIPPL